VNTNAMADAASGGSLCRRFHGRRNFHILSEGQIVKKAVYVAIGVKMDGIRDVLGMRIGENESAKFWMGILHGLKNRGAADILIACVGRLTGFTNAIEAFFPRTEIQHESSTKSETAQNLFLTRLSKRSCRT
jgi:hypothetical protein